MNHHDQENDIVAECTRRIMASFQEGKKRGDSAYGTRCYFEYGRELLERIHAMSSADRVVVLRSISSDGHMLLRGLAMSSAEHAVRTSDPAFLRYGLMALIIADSAEQARESLMTLSLLGHSASKLGADLYAEFESLRDLGNDATIIAFADWFRDGCRDINAMGYRESLETGEFKYNRG
jgi:hypothetical protein